MKRVLVCPLNWGLGHATRCVPIIRKEIEKGSKVIVGADGFPLKFLKSQFPQLTFIELKSYPIKYSEKGYLMIWQILKFFPLLFINMIQEHIWLDKFLENESIDKVISDNRFGLWSKKIHSVYITHQVMVKMPKRLIFLEKFSYYIHKKIMQQYTECWIPDVDEEKGLTGDLSHKYPLPSNSQYIGILSRFDIYKETEKNEKFENVIILSGIEPQRSIFEKKMTEKYQNKSEKTLMIIGKPNDKIQKEEIGQLTKQNHIADKELVAYLKGCKKVICRAGYSTVMDLETLGVEYKATYFPTPGQTEQEYLAVYLRNKK